MKLRKISWKNIGPYGNKLQTIEFPDEGGLWMVVGRNGTGKCVKKDTHVTIIITDKHTEEKFLKFIKK